MKITNYSLSYLKALLDNATPESLESGDTYEEFWMYIGSIFCDGQCKSGKYPECMNKGSLCFFMMSLLSIKDLKHSDRKLKYHYTLIDKIKDEYLIKGEYEFEEEKNPNIHKREAMEIASDMYDELEGGDF
jgi:hypothetical protein